MRRTLTPFLVALLLVPSLFTTHAQEADMAHFDSFDGLERVIARSWWAPITTETSTSAETVEINEQGTPEVIHSTEASPAATPEAQDGIAYLSSFVYLFDSDENAATGFERIDADLQEQHERDPRAPMMDDLPLDGIGDQARGYMGDFTQDDVTGTYTFATVQDGPFVYSLAGKFGGVDAAGLTGGYAESLIAAPMDRMDEQYDPDGDSRGGLWSKLNAVEPEMPPDSMVIDLIAYPLEEATPVAGRSETSPLDLDDPESIDGLVTLNQATYGMEGGATPAPDVAGVFRIDAWVLTFDSSNAARTAMSELSRTLTEPFRITSGEAGGGRTTTTTMISEGYIEDPTLPPGYGIVSLRQNAERVDAVVVYAIDEDPAPVADEMIVSMAGDFTIPPEERLPSDGDPALQGLVLVDAATPFGTPVPQPPHRSYIPTKRAA